MCSYRVLCPFATHVYVAKPEHKQADTPLTTSCFTSNSLSRSSIKITESRVVCAMQTLTRGEKCHGVSCCSRCALLAPFPSLPASQREGNICTHLLAMGCWKRRRISAFSFVSAGGFKFVIFRIILREIVFTDFRMPWLPLP